MIQEKKYDDNFTVLGLLGPAGSGKDLVADWLIQKHNFVKVPFADPIKRFATRCFGIEFERLWGPSEKRNEIFEIDDNWWLNAAEKMKIAATEITQEVLDENVRVQGFLRLFDWMANLREDYPEKISARVILQTLGTEWGRSIDSMMWARYAHKIASYLQENPRSSYSQTHGIIYNPEDAPRLNGVVIPDHRFLNEVKLTQRMGGHVLRLRRLALEQKDEVVGIVGHHSEYEQRTIPDEVFDYVFNFEEGVDKVYQDLEDVFTVKAWLRKEQASSSPS